MGGMISFVLRQNTEAAALKVITGTQLFKLAESLGGIKSLISHPASMTHKSIPPQKRRSAGVEDGLIRISVGLEEATDLIADLEQALHSLSEMQEHDNQIKELKKEKQFQLYNA